MTALTCPNGHAMDEGLFDCPACGAYRPSRAAFPKQADWEAEMRRGNLERLGPADMPRDDYNPNCEVRE